MVKESKNNIVFTRSLFEDPSISRRRDFREKLETRKIKIEFPSELGIVSVELGKTRVISQVTCESVKPYNDRPTEGFIRFKVIFSPMANPSQYDTKENELAIMRTLEKALKESRAIDTEGLCIVSGKHVWSIQVTVVICDYDGNAEDCASIATITSLLHVRRPNEEVTNMVTDFYRVKLGIKCITLF